MWWTVLFAVLFAIGLGLTGGALGELRGGYTPDSGAWGFLMGIGIALTVVFGALLIGRL